ncbi:DUF4760 domain-containing protein [Paraburkholderia phymatum]|uniref:DUF4760 domain-containing protein n=1 Tax=Paraburkholderia phymatum TaxID=148447 RepID=UPI003D181F3E
MRLLRKQLNTYWDAARGFGHEVRRMEKRDTFFQEIEHLAERWKRSPVAPNR